MGLIERLFGRKEREAEALYAAVVARGREPRWYVAGGVADSIDGRFDMIAAILSLVLLRLEALPGTETLQVALTESFVDDMDPQLREIGIGDVTVGKHMGKMMSMLGGRLGAYRDGLAAGSLSTALSRNLYREQPPSPAALAYTDAALRMFDVALSNVSADSLREGQLP